MAVRSAASSVFRNFGLSSGRNLCAVEPPLALSGLPKPARFARALEQLGGPYAAFAWFLRWRADLLPFPYLTRLRPVLFHGPVISREQTSQLLTAELGAAGGLLAKNLDAQPCWNTISRCAYRSEYQGRPVVVELEREPLTAAALNDFEKGLELLDDEVRHTLPPVILEQFREWLRKGESLHRERAYLSAMRDIQDRIAVSYPAPIPDLCTRRILCFEWLEGMPLTELLRRDSAQAAQRLAEAVLEQICTISALDGDLDFDALVLTPEGRLGVRHVERLIAVPPALASTALRYISAVLAGDTTFASHLLARLASGRTDLQLEAKLRKELSNLEPELKVDVPRFPESASIFEGNWRALARIRPERPLFLDLMHRNLLAAGYWNAEAAQAEPGAEIPDYISEAQWSVLGRLLRARVGDLANPGAISDLLTDSGLLMLESLRQVNRLAEDFRDKDLLLAVERQSPPEDSRIGNKRVRYGIYAGMLLALLVVSLRLAASAPAPVSGVCAAVAVVAGAGLFWAVSMLG